MAERLISDMERTLAAPEPIEALRALSALRARLDDFERGQVRRMLDDGESYTAVARALGISRQAAHRRYRHLTGPPVLSPEARDVLRRARAEAARLGADRIEAEHVTLALIACGHQRGDLEAARALLGPARPGSPPPTTLGPALHAALRRLTGTIGVEDLARVVRQLR